MLYWHVVPRFAGKVIDRFGIRPDSTMHKILTSDLRSSLVRRISRSIVVLQMYYDQSFLVAEYRWKNPFACATVLCFFDELVLDWFVTRLGGTKAPATSFALSEYRVKNKYRDISTALMPTCLLFSCQVGLFVYYARYLNYDGKTHSAQKLSYIRWLLAVLIAETVASDEVGAPFHMAADKRYYDMLIWGRQENADMELHLLHDVDHQISEDLDTLRKGHKTVLGLPMLYPLKVEWFLRLVFDAIVNGFIRSLVLITAPILLGCSGEMDFVQNCTAAFFIIKLDDFPADKPIQTVVTELKHNTRL